MAMSAQAWVNFTDQRAIDAQARAYVWDVYDRIENALVENGEKADDAMATVLSIRLIKDRVTREEALCWLARDEGLLHLIDDQEPKPVTDEATEAHFWATVDPVAAYR